MVAISVRLEYVNNQSKYLQKRFFQRRPHSWFTWTWTAEYVDYPSQGLAVTDFYCSLKRALQHENRWKYNENISIVLTYWGLVSHNASLNQAIVIKVTSWWARWRLKLPVSRLLA